MVVNLAQGQDYVGTPYDYTNIPGEFVPLPYGDIKSAYQQGGLLNAIKVAPAALFGIGVSSYDANKKK
jgi:hypothetical protein